MVEHLRGDIAAGAPRRDDIERDARAEAVGAVEIGRVGLALRELMIFVVGGNLCRADRLAKVRGVPRGRGRGRDVIEQPVIFVEVDEQHGARPDIGIGRERVEHLRGIFGALKRRRHAGMFGEGRGGDDPRHLGQAIGEHVLLELVEPARGERAAEQFGLGPVPGGRGGAIATEARERVVAEIVGHVLIDLEADPGFEQPLGIGRPAIAAMAARIVGQLVIAVVDRRPVAAAERVVRRRPDIEAVGIGAEVQRAVIMVGERERLGQRILEGDVGAGEVRHRMIVLVARPFAHAAIVPRRLAVGEAVRRAERADQAEIAFGIEPERRDQRGAGAVMLVGLDEHAARGRLGQRRGGDGETVAEAAHAVHRAEIMIEGAVFLGEDDDMLDIADRAGAPPRRDFERARDRRQQPRGRAARRHHRLDEGPPILNRMCHVVRPLMIPPRYAAAGRE